MDINQQGYEDQIYLIEQARQYEISVRLQTEKEILASLDFLAQTERYEGVCEATTYGFGLKLR